MGLLRRKWLFENIPKILKEMEYYRDYNSFMKLEKSTLWDTRGDIKEASIETARR